MNDPLVAQFLDDTIDPAAFGHEQHVRVTWLLLRDRPLPETMIALRDGLRRIAARAGHPEKYHETITFAFAAVMNERMREESWDEFRRRNPDLFTWTGGSVLSSFYAPSTLASGEARRAFVLPRGNPSA